jgi:hypothetical protein
VAKCSRRSGSTPTPIASTSASSSSGSGTRADSSLEAITVTRLCSWEVACQWSVIASTSKPARA